jgi:hypothetical protein
VQSISHIGNFGALIILSMRDRVSLPVNPTPLYLGTDCCFWYKDFQI